MRLLGLLMLWVGVQSQQQQVARLPWPANGMADVVSRTTPTLYHSSPLARWPALTRWTSLEQTQLTQVRRQREHGAFVFEDRTRMMAKLKPEWVPPDAHPPLNNLTAAIVLSADGQWRYYYSSRLPGPDLGQIEQEAAPRGFMKLTEEETRQLQHTAQ